ncbi:hypothetical protein DITRI_Ditri14bG0025900 [Diplodiscus trichospermus]
MNSEEKTLVEIIDENNRIDLAKYIHYVNAPQAGAIATFSGTMQNNSGAKINLGSPSYRSCPLSRHSSSKRNECVHCSIHSIASVPIWKEEVYSNGEVWKENKEFMERRTELGKDGGGCCRRKIETEAHDKKGCCKPKVKVDEAAS